MLAPVLVVFALLAPPAEKESVRQLREAVAGCDLLRVRSGAICHRRPKQESLLFEVRDPAEIVGFLDLLEIDEAASRQGFPCRCCGMWTVEFRRGGELVAEMDLHHGKSLRWMGWTYDGQLTPASRASLGRWLEEGRHRAGEEVRKQAREEEIRRRWKTIVPERVGQALDEARYENDTADALLRTGLDPLAQTLMLLRLYGCHEGTWTRILLAEGIVSAGLLFGSSADVLARVLQGAADDAWAWNGATRLLFADGWLSQHPGELAPALVARLARRALGSPREENRRITMAALGATGSQVAVGMLRAVLAGVVTPRDLPEAERLEPEGDTIVYDFAPGLLEARDDRVVAGYLLATLGDRKSLPALRVLAAANGPDAQLLGKALALLSR